MNADIYKWLTNRAKEDTILTELLKLGYLVGQKSWIHAVTSAIFGIFIPIVYDQGKCIWFWVLIVLMILDVIYAYICNEYKNKLYIQRKFSAEVLAEQSALINSMAIEIENLPSWRNKIFKTVSEMVCDAIYRNFKEIYNCETRVSVEYIFDKCVKNSTKIETHVKMSGRKSSHRKVTRKADPLIKRNQYYSYKIFTNNNTGINILSESEIMDEKIWFKNPNNNVNVKRYIGIAVSIGDDSVKFILQIDCLDDIIFGENNTENDVKEFVDHYMTAYINIISLSYLLNLNNKGDIQEV